MVSHYEDLGVFRLLDRVADGRALERFANEVLGELLAYDDKGLRFDSLRDMARADIALKAYRAVRARRSS